MPKKIIIRPPPKERKGIQESIKSFEKVAGLLRTLKDSGVSHEQRSKMLISDLVEVERPAKQVSQSEYETITEIRGVTGLSDYDACQVLQTILDVMIKALVSGQKIKLNRFGTFDLQGRPRSQTVTFSASPALVQALNEK